MTKQEIEKAIKNGESVWYIFNKELAEIDLSCNFHEIKNNELLTWYDKNSKDYYTHRIKLEDLHKTKAEAEHYLHHANISRTETLPFLTWEDIEIQMKKMESFGLNRNDRVLTRIITKDSIYYFKLCKDFDLFTFQLKQTYIGEDLCEQIRDKFPVSLGEATETNFYKAYDEAVKLFKGEE